MMDEDYEKMRFIQGAKRHGKTLENEIIIKKVEKEGKKVYSAPPEDIIPSLYGNPCVDDDYMGELKDIMKSEDYVRWWKAYYEGMW